MPVQTLIEYLEGGETINDFFRRFSHCHAGASDRLSGRSKSADAPRRLVRILLDECVDRRFAKEITGHEVVTVPQAGWAGIKNGELLTLAQEQFDVFLTVDRNLSFQQNLSQFTIAVVVLQIPTNRLKDLRLLAPKLQTVLPVLVKGQVRWVSLSP